MNLRREAKGRECMIRVPGYCNGDPATVVLCHINGAGLAVKAHDIHGAWGCSSCHDVVDGRVKTPLTPDERRLLLLDGVIRTQKKLLSEGKILTA